MASTSPLSSGTGHENLVFPVSPIKTIQPHIAATSGAHPHFASTSFHTLCSSTQLRHTQFGQKNTEPVSVFGPNSGGSWLRTTRTTKYHHTGSRDSRKCSTQATAIEPKLPQETRCALQWAWPRSLMSLDLSSAHVSRHAYNAKVRCHRVG